ncbi:helix-turn-helix domain-containing protein [Mycobacteroides abscessus subsp. massiliense]|uniref:helix-turn-helix domain-containing protein n=1 Tax=Mycobacteroides abscessus TaxID=36809 RepID=UPI0019D1B184|nr:helix-turn-helix transcriptional regulator [Mycobacteroides abscessus]MBN7315797.1 helix-turn-helix domain-containing protein [Mycobacteroides abscessus subsp. massiliense]
MPRPLLSKDERAQGKRLGGELRRLRGNRTAAEVADEAGVSLDTLRKLEQGGTPTPGFFLIARVARALDTPLNQLADNVMSGGRRRR